MRRLPGWTLAAAVALAVAAALSVGDAPVVAAPVSESGYWWRYQAAAGSPLAPPGVQAGQLYVAADALGTAATAAIRASVGSAVVEAITLKEVAASEAASVRACPTSGWTAPDGAGAFGSRPSEDRCELAGVIGVRGSTGTWTFAATDLVNDSGVLDVVFIPGTGDTEITFAAPGDDTVQLAAPSPSADLDSDSGDGIDGIDGFSGFAGFDGTPGTGEFAGLAELPTAEFAAAPSGVTAAALERDVSGYPAPAAPAASTRPPISGERAPLALLAGLLVAAAWMYRTRAAVAGAPQHVLAQPLRHRRDILASAGAALTTDTDTDLGASR